MNAPGPRELPACGDCQSPPADPDLEGELEAHGVLLVLPKRDCFGDLLSHENRGSARENHGNRGKSLKPLGLVSRAVFRFSRRGLQRYARRFGLRF